VQPKEVARQNLTKSSMLAVKSGVLAVNSSMLAVKSGVLAVNSGMLAIK
jgi:hypothetical protein